MNTWPWKDWGKFLAWSALHEVGVNERLEIGGIIMTIFDVRTKLSREVVDEVRENLPEQVFGTVVPRTVRIEAPSFEQTIFEYDKANPVRRPMQPWQRVISDSG